MKRNMRTIIVYALLVLAAMCWVSFFLITTFNLVAYGKYVFFFLLGGIIATALAAKFSVDVFKKRQIARRAAANAKLSPKKRFQKETIAAVALVIGVLFMMRDVLKMAFTDDPGTNDLTELAIGIAIIAGLLVALIAGYKAGRSAVEHAEMPADQSTRQADGADPFR